MNPPQDYDKLDELTSALDGAIESFEKAVKLAKTMAAKARKAK